MMEADVADKISTLPGANVARDTYPAMVSAIAPDLQTSSAAAAAWLAANRPAIDRLLLDSGAIIFRDFALPTAADFSAFIGAFDALKTGYAGGTSPRAVVTGQVMEATVAPPEREILLHQEMAYARDFPGKIAFYCEVPAQTGGETLVGNMRELTRQVDPALMQRIRERGVRHTRFFRNPDWYPGTDDLAVLHRTWHDAFSTTDRAEGERACIASGSECRWTKTGMQASIFSPGVVTHPATGEEIWFNQFPALNIDLRSVGRVYFEQYQRHYGADDPYPYEVTYGDGRRFTPEDTASLYAILDRVTSAPRWQAGDVMLLDNILAGHGRAAFTGERKVRVALLA